MTQPEHSVEYQAYLIKLAETNIAKGVIEEPRVYTQTFTTSEDEGVRSDPLTFRNGEKFPVRILYMTANTTSVNVVDPNTSPVSLGLYGERGIQEMGLRLRFHDQFYMRSDLVKLANWGTQVSASSDVNNLYTASHKCWRPVVLSARDSFEVRVKAISVIPTLVPSVDTPWEVTCTFTGVGLFSKRPYFLGGVVLLEDSATVTIPVDQFQNDGAEPILVTDCTFSAAQLSTDAPAVPVAHFVYVGVKQVGNGTNASWVISEPGVDTLASLFNWGTYSGRALVHRFPGQGLIWEPGEGIDLDLRQDPGDSQDPHLNTTNVSLVGYIAVQ